MDVLLVPFGTGLAGPLWNPTVVRGFFQVHFLEAYTKETAKKKLQYLVQYGLNAYFVHKVRKLDFRRAGHLGFAVLQCS